MLPVKTSDQEVANQRVPFGSENSGYIMHVSVFFFGGGVSLFGDIKLTPLVLNGLCDKFFILCKTSETMLVAMQDFDLNLKLNVQK